MIVIYDQSGDSDGLFEKLLRPTGIEYKLIENFSSKVIEDIKPTSIVLYLNSGMPKDVEEYFLQEKRDYLLIVMSNHDPEIDERIRYTAEIVIIDPNDLETSRKYLRQALTSYTVRKLRMINNTTVYLGKNGLYPGVIYYTKPENARTFFSLMFSDTIDKSKIFVASRFNMRHELPDLLNDNNFLWVTDSIGAQRNRPVNLTYIMDSIVKRIVENNSTVVFIDVFDLLIVYHDFYDVARAFEQVKSLAIERNIYLLLTFSDQAMDHIRFGQITRFAVEWNPSSIRDLT
ncbi:hypothetical protein IX51_06515 [uncultured archaeon]|nr:hypothetical protein IX51_06515 [uncultured archaeon]HKJ96247.1 DUF835 domain-containing protein [Thermoplasmataceae archaeon]